MSQIRRCAVKIKRAQKEIVKLAMESIAKTLGGKIVTQVSDFLFRNVRGDVVAAVKAPGMQYGYGVVIENGQPVIVGDPYGQRMGIRQFSNMFTQFYQTSAVQMALKSMGYTSNVTVLPNKNVMIRGVSGVPAVV